MKQSNFKLFYPDIREFGDVLWKQKIELSGLK